MLVYRSTELLVQMAILGVTEADVFKIVCSTCQSAPDVEYIGSAKYNTPAIRVNCRSCNQEVELKLLRSQWHGVEGELL